MSSVAVTGEPWFLTGSQHLDGPELRTRSPLQSRELARPWTPRRRCPPAMSASRS